MPISLTSFFLSVTDKYQSTPTHPKKRLYPTARPSMPIDTSNTGTTVVTKNSLMLRAIARLLRRMNKKMPHIKATSGLPNNKFNRNQRSALYGMVLRDYLTSLQNHPSPHLACVVRHWFSRFYPHLPQILAAPHVHPAIAEYGDALSVFLKKRRRQQKRR